MRQASSKKVLLSFPFAEQVLPNSQLILETKGEKTKKKKLIERATVIYICLTGGFL